MSAVPNLSIGNTTASGGAQLANGVFNGTVNFGLDREGSLGKCLVMTDIFSLVSVELMS